MKVMLTKTLTPYRGEAIEAGTIVETWVWDGILQVKGCWLPLKPHEWEMVEEEEGE